MKYIIFSINDNAQEYLFIIKYVATDVERILGELIKINNLCYIKGYEFDFFEIIEDPNYALNQEGIYIYEYTSYTNVFYRLDITLTAEELKDLRIKNKEIIDIMTKKNKQEILSIIHQKGNNYELFQKMFDPSNKKK
jgi:hypothetical protein